MFAYWSFRLKFLLINELFGLRPNGNLLSVQPCNRRSCFISFVFAYANAFWPLSSEAFILPLHQIINWVIAMLFVLTASWSGVQRWLPLNLNLNSFKGVWLPFNWLIIWYTLRISWLRIELSNWSDAWLLNGHRNSLRSYFFLIQL